MGKEDKVVMDMIMEQVFWFFVYFFLLHVRRKEGMQGTIQNILIPMVIKMH